MDEPPRQLLGREDRPGTVVLRLDGGEVLEVAPEALPPDLPDVGGSLGSPLVADLRAAAARKAAARDLLALLARKPSTTSRLERKLNEAGHPAAAVADVLAQAERQGLHSDRAFAEAWCRDTLRRKAVGRAWLVVKLREKGVPEVLADEVAAAQLPDAVEADLARRAAAARWARQRDRDRRAVARVQRFLASRGFPPALASRTAWATRPECGPDDPDSSCISGPEGPS